MNTNALHNILNLIGLVVGSLIAFDWAGLGLSPPVAAAIASGLLVADKVIKLGMNILRDGFGGLFKPQPPVIK
jgi:hypothetical protein